MAGSSAPAPLRFFGPDADGVIAELPLDESSQGGGGWTCAIESFVRAVRDGEPLVVLPEQTLLTTRILERIVESAAAGTELPLQLPADRESIRADRRRTIPEIGTVVPCPPGARRGLYRSSRLATVGPPTARGGRSSAHVHALGSLSGRNRSNFVPWRKRRPCTLS